MAENPLISLANRQKAELAKLDESALRQLIGAYRAMYGRMGGEIDALLLAIEKADGLTVAELKRLPQYKRLVENSTTEMGRFVVYLETVIGAAALGAIDLGLAHSAATVNLVTGGGFRGLGSEAMQYLLDYLRTDGPLYKRLSLITNSTVESVVQSIVDGVGSGFNPRKIASGIQSAFGGGLTDALRNTRTVQLWSYRDSARANYTASGGIVQGWIWYAAINEDPPPCPACLAEHGTIHPLDEQLDGHYNCRCAPIPYIPGVTDEIASGQSWFDAQDEAVQRDILGAGKYDAYKAGSFDFSQLSKQVENDVYGHMRVETPLKDLINE